MKESYLVNKAKEAVKLFVEFKKGNDEASFSFDEAEKEAENIGIHVSTIITLAKEAGLSYSGRDNVKKVRGYTTGSNDRWYGPGSSKTYGGSGQTNIIGFSGNPAKNSLVFGSLAQLVEQ